MSLAPGVSLGPYEIIELIGRGGMGEVYRARDPRLRRDVAVKRSILQFDERFEREARAIAALNHPNICQVYDVGPDYLVMELVEGVTLAERIKQGPIPVDEALRLAEQIGEALAAAHEKLITHRDLKPGNIKIDDAGTVKVLDFGLARIGQADSPGIDDGNSPTLSMNATRAGLILGTAAYMSPEQARGKPADARSDIWAFGVVLYEMLTAKRLFTGDDLTDTLASIVKDDPDLSVVPSAVRPLIRACLQKDPRRRLQAIGDRHLLLSPQNERQGSHWFWPAVAGAAVAGVTVFAAAALSWAYFKESPPALQSLRYQITPTAAAEFAESQISPDGRYLAFAGRPQSAGRLYVRALDSLEAREVPDTDGTSYPFWSPDSAHIGFFSRGKLRQVALAGGPATVLADASDGRGGTWGEDGTIVFAPAVTGTLSRVSASGGPVTTLSLPRPEARPRDSLRFPTFLPSSDHFLYTIESDTRDGEGVYLGSLAGTAPVRILPDLTLTLFVASPGSRSHGHILFRRQTTLMAQPFDIAREALEGDAFPVAEQMLNSGNTGFGDFSVSSNGTLIYAAGASPNQGGEIVWVDRDGKRGASILKQEGVTDFALSPDGSQLLYSLASQNVPGDLWLRDVARGASQRFTFGPFSAYGAVWSPNGRTAAFTAFPEDRLYIEVLAAAKPEATAVIGTNTYATSWSADGRLLAYSQTGGSSKDDVWLMSLDGERKARPLRQTPFSENSAQLSPDGRWIAYQSDASGKNEVYVESIEVPGAPRPVSLTGGSAPMWRRDGRELFFLATDRTMMSVDVRSGEALTFGVPQALFREQRMVLTGRSGSTFQPSSDGRQFLMLLSASESSNAPLTVVTNWQHNLGRQP